MELTTKAITVARIIEVPVIELTQQEAELIEKSLGQTSVQWDKSHGFNDEEAQMLSTIYNNLSDLVDTIKRLEWEKEDKKHE